MKDQTSLGPPKALVPSDFRNSFYDLVERWNKKTLGIWEFLEIQLGSVKFAVIIILGFALALIVGTFQESWHGTEYANRLIYKSWWFMGLQALMFLSIMIATLLRLPPKKRLYGFYLLHSGLLILFIGSFVTYRSGIDGTLPLYPGSSTRNLELPGDVLVFSLGEGKNYQVELPEATAEVNLQRSLAGLSLGRYLPYAGEKIDWVKDDVSAQMGQGEHLRWPSSQIRLQNDRFSEELTFSLHPLGSLEFEASTQLGPLAIHYLPGDLAACFTRIGFSQIILWDSRAATCFTPEERKIPINQTKSGNRFLAYKDQGQIFTFFPDISPYALDESFTPNENSLVRSLALDVFTDSPNLLLMSEKIAFFDKSIQKWKIENFPQGSTVPLPWMGFRLTHLKTSHDHYPKKVPYFEKPIQMQGELTQGQRKAVEIEIAGKRHWVLDNRPLRLNFGEDILQFAINKKTLPLAFEMSLDRFKMDTNPGTMDPASYESFVNLFNGKENSLHHIFMNNPLKFNDFTFYQASYFQTQEGHGSVLSVNYDPGRSLKYLGSLLLVLGSIWHFWLNRPPRRRKSNVSQQT